MSLTFSEMEVGAEASYTRVVTMEMVKAFAELSGDTNPVHTDPEYAKTTIFKENIAHGILTAGFISKVMGCDLPGYGSIYISQELNFLRPVKIGDEITATAIVKSKDEKSGRCTMDTFCTNQRGKKVVSGEAVILPRKDKV